MDKYDNRLELAPRDIVARAIDSEMKNNNFDHVNLDISFKDKSLFYLDSQIFIRDVLMLGIDITKQPIPVVPAAHYTCGGIETNISGETDCVKCICNW